MSRLEKLRQELSHVKAELDRFECCVLNEHVRCLEGRHAFLANEILELEQQENRDRMKAAVDRARQKINDAAAFKGKIEQALEAGLSVHFYSTGVTLEHHPTETRIDYYKGATFDEAWDGWFNGDPFLSDDLICIEEEPDDDIDGYYMVPTDNTPLSQFAPDNTPVSQLRDQPMWIYEKRVAWPKRRSWPVRLFLFLKSRLWDKPSVDDLISDIKGDKS